MGAGVVSAQQLLRYATTAARTGGQKDPGKDPHDPSDWLILGVFIGVLLSSAAVLAVLAWG